MQYHLVAAGGGKCQRCLKTFHPNIYDWHHRDPRMKEFNINKVTMDYSLSTLKKEIHKCVLLCANCHREVHTFRDRRFLVFPAPGQFGEEDTYENLIPSTTTD